jgi:hypothetical protein
MISQESGLFKGRVWAGLIKLPKNMGKLRWPSDGLAFAGGFEQVDSVPKPG